MLERLHLSLDTDRRYVGFYFVHSFGTAFNSCSHFLIVHCYVELLYSLDLEIIFIVEFSM